MRKPYRRWTRRSFGWCVPTLRTYTTYLHYVLTLRTYTRTYTTYLHYVPTLRTYTTYLHYVLTLRTYTTYIPFQSWVGVAAALDGGVLRSHVGRCAAALLRNLHPPQAGEH